LELPVPSRVLGLQRAEAVQLPVRDAALHGALAPPCALAPVQACRQSPVAAAIPAPQRRR
jgi:hypothetical protein